MAELSAWLLYAPLALGVAWLTGVVADWFDRQRDAMNARAEYTAGM